MGRKTLPQLIAALLMTLTANAQSTGEIRGTVSDPDGNPLYLANVHVERPGGTQGTSTDMDGHFVLKPLEPGTYTVRISFVGYTTAEVRDVYVLADKITRLKEQRLTMNNDLPIIDISTYARPQIEPEEPGKMSLLASEFKNDPNLKDPVRMIAKSFAGVTPAPNGDGLYFRGSRSDNMAYYVDGVKMGGLSGVPSSAIRSITVYTGGLPARYGDVTGGVIAIETKSYLDVIQERHSMH
ncbi:MAG: carboxypeptidase regulatory-like domain-containing protein [Flavobacteriales bacterium]|nr:carboxypeptidase regulatory-like domain-containing protein [Flavobacteriales bacterium]MCB9166731.1 carboxypeptidase regulatory-like domain-containing protein [Flavobacteriales bacterium]